MLDPLPYPPAMSLPTCTLSVSLLLPNVTYIELEPLVPKSLLLLGVTFPTYEVPSATIKILIRTTEVPDGTLISRRALGFMLSFILIADNNCRELDDPETGGHAKRASLIIKISSNL